MVGSAFSLLHICARACWDQADLTLNPEPIVSWMADVEVTAIPVCSIPVLLLPLPFFSTLHPSFMFSFMFRTVPFNTRKSIVVEWT